MLVAVTSKDRFEVIDKDDPYARSDLCAVVVSLRCKSGCCRRNVTGDDEECDEGLRTAKRARRGLHLDAFDFCYADLLLKLHRWLKLHRERTMRKFPFDRQTLAWSLMGTLAIELVCIVMRFGFGQESTKATASTIGMLTFGIRVHHGYIGALMIPVGYALHETRARVGWWLFTVGVSLFLSDMIHHFLVLWPITGSPQFDLVYPS